MKNLTILITSLYLLGVVREVAAETNPLQDELKGKSAQLSWEAKVLRESIENLGEKYPDLYGEAPFLARLDRIERDLQSGYTFADNELQDLKRQALFAHPKLRDAEILSIKIGVNQEARGACESFGHMMNSLGLPVGHLSLSSMPDFAKAGEIVRLSALVAGAEENVVVEPIEGQPLAGLNLHWDGGRLLFARRADGSWNIFEVNADGSHLRRVSQHDDDISTHEPCYLPNGDIMFASDAVVQGVPCWHGIPNKVANLYSMDSEGNHVRRLCYDQGHNAEPTVLRDGRVIFNRWDYTGMNRVFNRLVMEMRPDGTAQRAFFGTNTWYPNGIYGHKQLPGSNKIVCIVSGYHDGNRAGYIGILDPAKGDRGDGPLVEIITGTPLPPRRIVADRMTSSVRPLFVDPEPLDEEYFLVSALRDEDSYEFSIHLADVFGNLVPIKGDARYAYLKPTLLQKRKLPTVLPSQVDLDSDYATVYIQDVYAGPGLEGVDRDVVKKVRVIGYDYGYPTLAGVDKIGMTGPWDAMQILGEATVNTDGSAFFKVPADTPIAFQMVDGKGRAVQLMRTWTTAMPGERMSCVGCHEGTNVAPLPTPTLALQSEPQELERWHGPARGFDFAREIQPVLNKNCTSCHDGSEGMLDLRPKDQVEDYVGTVPSWYDRNRLHQKYKDLFGGAVIVPYTPAYEALAPYIRRVGAGDGVSLLVPGEYKANTSPLIQLLEKSHHGLSLGDDDLERFYTWIDLNGPSHGTWKEVYGVTPAEGMYELRQKYKKLYGSKQIDLDTPVEASYDETPVEIAPPKKRAKMELVDWPFDASEFEPETMEVDLGEGATVKMVRLTGRPFVMGDVDGQSDESPLTRVDLRNGFWISETEISNAQFRAFQQEHDSRFYGKRHLERTDNQGIPLDRDEQPAVRVSWDEAAAFCQWLSAKTGKRVNLPTEAQWEYACRAGSEAAFSFGDIGADYSLDANLADLSFATKGITGRSGRNLFVVASDLESLISEGVALADRTFDDGMIVTANVEQYQPNAFGLKNMHGNAAEWTRSLYRPYPYGEDDGRNAMDVEGNRVVRGGSFFDPPKRSRAAFRLSYPSWQRVHNVGFRIVVEDGDPILLSENAGN